MSINSNSLSLNTTYIVVNAHKNVYRDTSRSLEMFCFIIFHVQVIIFTTISCEFRDKPVIYIETILL